jgi:hypothetical protein
MIVTPRHAAAWLTLDHDHGGPVCIATVAAYADLMRGGRWANFETATPVHVAARLVNGRHRLMAVLLSGVDVDLPVELST